MPSPTGLGRRLVPAGGATGGSPASDRESGCWCCRSGAVAGWMHAGCSHARIARPPHLIMLTRDNRHALPAPAPQIVFPTAPQNSKARACSCHTRDISSTPRAQPTQHHLRSSPCSRKHSTRFTELSSAGAEAPAHACCPGPNTRHLGHPARARSGRAWRPAERPPVRQASTCPPRASSRRRDGVCGLVRCCCSVCVPASLSGRPPTRHRIAHAGRTWSLAAWQAAQRCCCCIPLTSSRRGCRVRAARARIQQLRLRTRQQQLCCQRWQMLLARACTTVQGRVAHAQPPQLLTPAPCSRVPAAVQDGLPGQLPVYRGTVDAVRTIVRTEGWRGLYAGLAPSILGSSEAAADAAVHAAR